jgi:transglutaminase-like putative cysteine protease
MTAIYDVQHVTTYRYDAPVASARCAIRLSPRSDFGQRVVCARIDVVPAPHNLRERVDFFGNRIAEATIFAAHTRLRVAVSARVEVTRAPQPAANLTLSWEETRRAAAGGLLDALSPAHFLFPSRLAPLNEAVAAYVRESFPAGRPILAGALDAMRRIHADFDYDPVATEVSTPLAEAFKRRGGVCQDFAHIMISGLRGIGLPAAYVSGYMRTTPAPGQARLEGADASHAWVAVWCGAEFGWLHFDPTNALPVGEDHIIAAMGRDYADVSPIDGVVLSSGGQNLEVSVDVRPLDDSPAKAAVEPTRAVPSVAS